MFVFGLMWEVQQVGLTMEKSFHNIICLTQSDLLYTIFNIINDFVDDVLLLPFMYHKMIFNPFV